MELYTVIICVAVDIIYNNHDHLTFKQSLYPSHLLNHGCKLGVLCYQFLYLSLASTRATSNTGYSTGLFEQLGSLGMV